MRRLRSSALAVILAVVPLGAHDIWRSESRLTANGREIDAVLTVNLLELRGFDLPRTGQVSYSQLSGKIDDLFSTVKNHYRLRSDGDAESVTLTRYLIIDDHLLNLDIRYKFPGEVNRVDVHSTLHQIMEPGHQHLISVRLNGRVQESILDASHPDFTTATDSKAATAWRFIRLGIEHIFTGYDHLAFLLGLLVAAASFRSLIAIITSFTIAHSITLALATLGFIALPARLTESLIAVSIAWVAAENLFGFRVVKRHYVTFLFGLVHGFGFSNVLREMDLPRSSMALSLFAFNFGVEIGQVAFVFLIFPVVQDLMRSGWARLKPAVSAAVGCLALYWFVERAFLG